MPKYTVTVMLAPLTLTIDTEAEEFASAFKDQEIDVNDVDAVREWVEEDPEFFGVDPTDTDIQSIEVILSK